MSVVFDFDSTLVCDETLVSLIKSCTQDEEIIRKVEEITLLGIQGKIDMISSYQQRLILARPTVKSLNKYLETIIEKITPGMERIIHRIQKETDLDIHIVSQGPFACILPVAKHLKIPNENVHAVPVNFELGEVTGLYIQPNEEILAKGKVKMVEKWIQDGQISTPFIMVGDGMSDMRVSEAGLAKVGICFGLHLKIKEAKAISTHYVETIADFEKILFEEIQYL